MKKTSDDVYGDETHRSLKMLAPIHVYNLNTLVGRKVTKSHKRNGMWLSEMYLYIPSMRSALRTVLKELRASGLEIVPDDESIYQPVMFADMSGEG
jgi:hypothetical protein